jgi:hypothetical protein
MGFYWSTYLYMGRLCSPEARDRVVASGLKTDGFLVEVSKERWVLHAPGRFVTMGSIDPILEAHEKNEGKVSLAEAMEWLAKREEENTKWNSVSAEDLAHLQKLITAAAAPDEGNTAPGVYICEVSWSTLDMPADAGSRVTYNLRCI